MDLIAPVIGVVELFVAVEALMKLVKLYVETRWLPLMNIVAAYAVVFVGWYSGFVVGTLGEVVWMGLLLGLSVGGFYKVRKSIGMPL